MHGVIYKLKLIIAQKNCAPKSLKFDGGTFTLPIYFWEKFIYNNSSDIAHSTELDKLIKNSKNEGSSYRSNIFKIFVRPKYNSINANSTFIISLKYIILSQMLFLIAFEQSINKTIFYKSLKILKFR